MKHCKPTALMAFILAVGFGVSLLLSTRAHADPPGGSKWELTFKDVFEADTLDREVWTVTDHGDRLAKNVEVKEGQLHLKTLKHPSEDKGCKEWSTAFITTKKFRQKYGYFEAKIKIAPASGLNNAFWLNTPSERLKGDIDRFEVDIVEAHYPKSVHMALHNWSGKHTDKGIGYKSPDDLSNEFHIYGLLWKETELVWYIDGREVGRMKHEICKSEEAILFSTKVADFAGKPSDKLDGVSMDVDWVRVYQKKQE